MSWGAVIGVVGGAVVGHLGNKGNERAAGASADAQYASIDEQRRQYDQSREDMAPWLGAGRNALAGLQGLLTNPDSIQDSQAYQWQIGQGLNALDRSAAAGGALGSGGHQTDLLRFGQGLASQEYGNQWNRLAGLAGVGQTAASSLGSLGAGMAGNIGNALGNIGNARSSMYQQNAQNTAGFAAGVGGAFNNWYQNNLANNPGGTGWYLGNNPGKG